MRYSSQRIRFWTSSSWPFEPVNGLRVIRTRRSERRGYAFAAHTSPKAVWWPVLQCARSVLYRCFPRLRSYACHPCRLYLSWASYTSVCLHHAAKLRTPCRTCFRRCLVAQDLRRQGLLARLEAELVWIRGLWFGLAPVTGFSYKVSEKPLHSSRE